MCCSATGSVSLTGTALLGASAFDACLHAVFPVTPRLTTRLRGSRRHRLSARCPPRTKDEPPADAPAAAPPLRPHASRTPPGSRASASHPGTGSNHTTPAPDPQGVRHTPNRTGPAVAHASPQPSQESPHGSGGRTDVTGVECKPCKATHSRSACSHPATTRLADAAPHNPHTAARRQAGRPRSIPANPDDSAPATQAPIAEREI
jgi:hypothetical protein